MISIIICVVLVVLLLIGVIYKSKDTIDDTEAIIADIFILISTSSGTLGVLNLILTRGLTIPESFYTDSMFLIAVSCVSMFFVYLYYFKRDGYSGFLWFCSEILMSLGITSVAIGIIYLNIRSSHIPQEILKSNFPSFFKTQGIDSDAIALTDFILAGTLVIILFGISTVVLALIFNSIKVKGIKSN